MSLSDRLLVQEALSGNKTAFGPLVERHRAMVLRLARRMVGDPADAEDIVQEACLQAFLGLARLRDPERFAAWLYGIVLNLSHMRLRRGRREEYSLEDLDGGRVAWGFTRTDVQPSLEAANEERELQRVVLSAIGLLPGEQQAAVRQHYLDGLTLSEMSMLTDTQVGTVKARLLEAARVTVQRVAVSRLHEEVFYATLWLGVGGEVQALDARPSDALALALRVKSPIFVDESILSAAGVAPQNLQARLAKCLPEECKPLVPEAAGEEWQSLTEIARTG